LDDREEVVAKNVFSDEDFFCNVLNRRSLLLFCKKKNIYIYEYSILVNIFGAQNEYSFDQFNLDSVICY